MMSTIIEQRPPAVNAVSGDGEEEIFGIHVLVNHVQAPLLVRQALALAALNEAGVLYVQLD